LTNGQRKFELDEAVKANRWRNFSISTDIDAKVALPEIRF
jgi:hypothetical protein